VIDESDSQDEKHFHPRISTFLGIMIDSSDDLQNASDPIRIKCEFDSNTIDLSDPCSFSKVDGQSSSRHFRKVIESGIQAR
jgi:hypothetical protein